MLMRMALTCSPIQESAGSTTALITLAHSPEIMDTIEGPSSFVSLPYPWARPPCVVYIKWTWAILRLSSSPPRRKQHTNKRNAALALSLSLSLSFSLSLSLSLCRCVQRVVTQQGNEKSLLLTTVLTRNSKPKATE